ARVLLFGFLYAAASSHSEEMVAVGIKEQDMVTRIYSVRKTDLFYFVDGKITINDFARRIYMAQVRSR
ncbi:MAG: hypothetical protein ACRCUT_09585, partial [Spirochaetota bacterium]